MISARSTATIPELMKVGRAEFQEAASGQVTYLNTLTLDAIDDVLGASDDPPVIIVMSITAPGWTSLTVIRPILTSMSE